MVWNHRIMRREESGDFTYAIHEVHYEAGKVVGWARNPTPVLADTADTVAELLSQMTRACGQPVLDWRTGQEVGESPTPR